MAVELCFEASCGYDGVPSRGHGHDLLAAAGFGDVVVAAAGRASQPDAGCAVLDWAASGAMALTGHHDAPLVPSSPVMTRARSVACALSALSALVGERVEVDVRTALSGRAALAGLARRGRTAPGGSCRLLPTIDGWVAVNLARDADMECVPAVVAANVALDDPWPPLAGFAASTPAREVAERCQLVGVPAAAVGDPALRELPPLVAHAVTDPDRVARPASGGRLVVDLSSMWSGPMCAQLLGRAGMRVVKVESVQRPDGARAGSAEFFDWLHAGHESVALDFSAPEGRRCLRRLLERADVVIDSARPRAMEQLGIDVTELLAARPGRVWVSITGYGRRGPRANWVAFGDDAAAAGGLVAWDRDASPVFCGDAIADPMSGLYAALGAVASLADGGGHLVEVTLAGVSRSLALPADRTASAALAHAVYPNMGDWVARCAERFEAVGAPRPPALGPKAERLGGSTERVLTELDG